MITELKVYDAIKPKLGEEEAKMLLELMEIKAEKTVKATSELVTKATSELVTKADLSQTESRIVWKLLVFFVGQLGIIIASVKLFAT